LAKIFCIVGASCSGKDTIFQRLIEVDKTLTPIVTYTTRPIRPKERNGKEYYFVDNKVYHKLKNANKIIESRSYKTAHGTWHYFTANDGQIDAKSDKSYIMVNTLEGVQKLRNIYHNNLVVIHICVEERDRLLRCIAREMNNNEDYVEMCRRFVSDAKDYSENNFDNMGIQSIRVYNESIPNCINEIRNVIKAKK
jgi:putative guanylate kinase